MEQSFFLRAMPSENILRNKSSYLNQYYSINVLNVYYYKYYFVTMSCVDKNSPNKPAILLLHDVSRIFFILATNQTVLIVYSECMSD